MSTEKDKKTPAKRKGGQQKGVAKNVKYDPNYHPGRLFELCQKGMIDTEICKSMGIGLSTLYDWQNKHVEFMDAKQQGKRVIDDTVEAAMYKKATGFSKAGKYYPPDTTAQIFWLKNRRPKVWRDRREVQVDAEIKAVSDLRRVSDDDLIKYLEEKKKGDDAKE